MAIIKYRNAIDDWFNLLDDEVKFFERSTWRCLYDPSKYDLVPKDSYKKELVKQKEEEIKLLDDKRKQLFEDLEKLKAG